MNDGIICGMLSKITGFLDSEKPQRQFMKFGTCVCVTEANLRIVGGITKTVKLIVACLSPF